MLEQNKQSPETFDPKSLKISPEATADFYTQEGEHGSSPIKVAFDSQGRKVLLKTATFFKPENQKNREAQLSLDAFAHSMEGSDVDEELERMKNIIFSEERGYRLAQLIGVPMAETRYVERDGIPFVAYQFLEGAVDKHIGNKVEIAADAERRGKQEEALALSTLLKVWLSAGDGGQYLQTPDGNIYLSDLATFHAQEMSPESLAFQLKHNYDFPRSHSILERVIAGMKSPAFQSAMDKLSKLTASDLLPIISRERKSPTPEERELSERYVQRLTVVLPFFRSLSADPTAPEKIGKILLK